MSPIIHPNEPPETPDWQPQARPNILADITRDAIRARSELLRCLRDELEDPEHIVRGTN